MTEYDELLKEARTVATQSARSYIPRMYDVLLRENRNMTPHDARERIEKDCIDFWSKRTILDALPPAAKDPVKQRAGKQARRNKQESAAEAAAQPISATITKEDVVVMPQNNGMASLLKVGGSATEEQFETGKERLSGDNDACTTNIISSSDEEKEARSSNVICKVYRDKFASLFAVLRNSKEVCNLEFGSDLVFVRAWADSTSSIGDAP